MRRGSKAGIKAYLADKVGIVVEAADLQAAANGAAEWARRLRELREEGWKISSHNDRNDLRPGQYVLEAKPDSGAYRFPRAISSRLRGKCWNATVTHARCAGRPPERTMDKAAPCAFISGISWTGVMAAGTRWQISGRCAASVIRERRTSPRNRRPMYGS